MSKKRFSALPSSGLIRMRDLLGDRKKGYIGIVPFSEATLWQRVKDGTFPAPIKISANISAWRIEDIRAWLDAQGNDPP